ncbi:MAG: hypothetical protein WBA17_10595 [Saprospiraceae bacterium]
MKNSDQTTPDNTNRPRKSGSFVDDQSRVHLRLSVNGIYVAIGTVITITITLVLLYAALTERISIVEERVDNFKEVNTATLKDFGSRLDKMEDRLYNSRQQPK